jgi:hypothetical protein
MTTKREPKRRPPIWGWDAVAGYLGYSSGRALYVLLKKHGDHPLAAVIRRNVASRRVYAYPDDLDQVLRDQDTLSEEPRS